METRYKIERENTKQVSLSFITLVRNVSVKTVVSGGLAKPKSTNSNFSLLFLFSNRLTLLDVVTFFAFYDFLFRALCFGVRRLNANRKNSGVMASSAIESMEEESNCLLFFEYFKRNPLEYIFIVIIVSCILSK